MRLKKEENSRQSRNTSPSKEGKNRKSAPKRSLSEKTSYKKTEAPREGEKRRTRRNFSTEDRKDTTRKRFGDSENREGTGRKKENYGRERFSSRRNDGGFDNKRGRKPAFHTETEQEGRKSFHRNDKDTFRRKRDFDKEDNKRAYERKPQRERRFTDKEQDGERSYRRNDRDTFRQRRDFDKEDNKRAYDRKPQRERRFTDKDQDGEKSYRRNDRDTFRRRRDFDREDNNRSYDRKPQRERRFTDKEQDGEKSYRRNDRDTFRRRRDFDRENNNRSYDRNPRKERRSTVLDSDIMREIIQKRRATGRSSHKPKVLSLAWSEDRGPIRLNKYIANSGICSRREADSLITAGAITVNGEVVTELGTKVMPVDEVRYGDKVLQREKPVYILLNKPKGFITTTDDEKGRDNVMMLVEGACPERVYPVGRLDRDTTGLLLFTNDGEITKKLTHPRHEIKKIYQVELDMDMSLVDFETLVNGIELEDGLMKPDEVAFVEGQRNIIGIELHSGRNRVVRRLFAHLGYEIEKLDRVYYAGLTKKDLPRGEWRFLRQEEINILKRSL
jgi:23S rRNA pseudouridine2605 synthase